MLLSPDFSRRARRARGMTRFNRQSGAPYPRPLPAPLASTSLPVPSGSPTLVTRWLVKLACNAATRLKTICIESVMPGLKLTPLKSNDLRKKGWGGGSPYSAEFQNGTRRSKPLNSRLAKLNFLYDAFPLLASTRCRGCSSVERGSRIDSPLRLKQACTGDQQVAVTTALRSPAPWARQPNGILRSDRESET
jgi:hypothetical protein